MKNSEKKSTKTENSTKPTESSRSTESTESTESRRSDLRPGQMQGPESRTQDDYQKSRNPGEREELKERKEDLPYNPDVTKEDLDSLQHENIHRDGGDDEDLLDRTEDVDFTGKDLDVPGSETAKRSGRKGMTDEENQLFSQGGPDKENLREDDSAL